MDALLHASAPLLGAALTLWGSPVTWLEILACVLSVWMVLCNLRVNPLGWPLAMLSSLLYALLFVSYKLYGEASLQLFFVLMAGWGWWQWRGARQANGQPLVVRRMHAQQLKWAALATLAAWPLLALLLRRFTDSDVPWLDALPTVASITGQVLLGRKLIENWPLWIGVNLLSMGLFAWKALWLTVLLYAVFAVLAGLGWRAWQKLEGRAHA
jgi:nicotinamide mononucleotide transporter